jgi:hypothetical protein
MFVDDSLTQRAINLINLHIQTHRHQAHRQEHHGVPRQHPLRYQYLLAGRHGHIDRQVRTVGGALVVMMVVEVAEVVNFRKGERGLEASVRRTQPLRKLRAAFEIMKPLFIMTAQHYERKAIFQRTVVKIILRNRMSQRISAGKRHIWFGCACCSSATRTIGCRGSRCSWVARSRFGSCGSGSRRSSSSGCSR